MRRREKGETARPLRLALGIYCALTSERGFEA